MYVCIYIYSFFSSKHARTMPLHCMLYLFAVYLLRIHSLKLYQWVSKHDMDMIEDVGLKPLSITANQFLISQ